MSLKAKGGRGCQTLPAPVWPHREPLPGHTGTDPAPGAGLNPVGHPLGFGGTGGCPVHSPACGFEASMQSFPGASTKCRGCKSRTRHSHHIITEAQLHVTQLLPLSPLSLSRQDTEGTPSPTVNLPSPRGCTLTPGQRLCHRRLAGLGALAAGAAPAVRDERAGRDNWVGRNCALSGDRQGTGGSPRRLAPFPIDPGSTVANTHPATAPSEALAAGVVQGCSRSWDALTGTCLLPHSPASVPQHPSMQRCPLDPQKVEPQAEGCEPGQSPQYVPDPVVPCPSPPLHVLALGRAA